MTTVAGITSIINPAKSDEILLFHINAKQYVKLDAKSTTSKKTTSTFGTESATSDGPMAKASALSSLRHDDLVTVYGVVNSTNGTTTTAEVSMISPVYQPLGLASDTTYGRIASTLRPESNGGYTTFIYYRKPSELQTIYEKALTDDDSDERSYKPSTVGDKTYLTTYYDKVNKARHVIFQDNNNSIHDYDITDDSRAKIANATDAIASTGLAAVWHEESSQVYLYYSTKDGSDYKLRRIVKSSGGSWGSPAFPSKAPLLNQTTQMSATPASTECHVFYVGTSSKGGIQHYADTWSNK